MNKLSIAAVIGLLLVLIGIEGYRAYNEHLHTVITEQNNIKMQELQEREIISNYRSRR